MYNQSLKFKVQIHQSRVQSVPSFDPNSANNTSFDTITDVRGAIGLAGTGQNLLLWIGAAVAIVIAAVASFMFVRRRRLA
jgi:LPXTG-motif cell wall-anchored protein